MIILWLCLGFWNKRKDPYYKRHTKILSVGRYVENKFLARIFACLFPWNLAIICVRANVLRVAHSSISQNNQGVGYRVCMCIGAAMCATLTPAGSKSKAGFGIQVVQNTGQAEQYNTIQNTGLAVHDTIEQQDGSRQSSTEYRMIQSKQHKMGEVIA